MSETHFIAYKSAEDRSTLVIVTHLSVFDYEFDESRRASSKEFYDRKLAVEHAKKLAEKHGKAFEDDHDDGLLD